MAQATIPQSLLAWIGLRYLLKSLVYSIFLKVVINRKMQGIVWRWKWLVITLVSWVSKVKIVLKVTHCNWTTMKNSKNKGDFQKIPSDSRSMQMPHYLFWCRFCGVDMPTVYMKSNRVLATKFWSNHRSTSTGFQCRLSCVTNPSYRTTPEPTGPPEPPGQCCKGTVYPFWWTNT